MPSAPPLTTGSCSLSSLPKVAAASLARPMIDRQSGRFGVISNSMTWSSAPMMGLMSSPGLMPSSCRIKIPSGMQLGNSACSACRSARVQIMPDLVLYASMSPSWILWQSVWQLTSLPPISRTQSNSFTPETATLTTFAATTGPNTFAPAWISAGIEGLFLSSGW